MGCRMPAYFESFLEQGLARMGDGKAILTATTAFRNEPWR